MALAAAAIGFGLQAGATIIGGISENEIAQENARETERTGEFNRRAKEVEFRRSIGKARVTTAASGVALEEGSPLEVAEENLMIAEQNLQNITRTASKQAGIQRKAGRAALLGGFLGGISDLFFGISEISSLRKESAGLSGTKTGSSTSGARGVQGISPNIFTGPDVGGSEILIG